MHRPFFILCSGLAAALMSIATACGPDVSVAGGSSSPSGGGGGCAGPTIGLPATPCTPQEASCQTQTSVCLAVQNNAGAATFSLRMAQLDLTAPAVFASGAFANLIASAVMPDQPACNLQGQGTFSWLLSFDTAAGQIKTGGGKPVQNPAQGYTFVDEDMPLIAGTVHAGPITLHAPLDNDCAFESASGMNDLNIPIYLTYNGTSYVLLPLRKLTFLNGKLSSDHNCIGTYNASGLSPVSACLPELPASPAFLPGASVTAFITLEEADLVPIDFAQRSLCVVLAFAGDGGIPMERCKRSSGGKIAFRGDWCAATNLPADTSCADAVLFSGTFAASGVKIN